jgi:hypothetical protein
METRAGWTMQSNRTRHSLSLLTVLRGSYRRLASLEERRKIFFLRIAVLASSVLLMLPGAWGHSVTVVEFGHLPAGLAAWQRHSLGIYRVCGPLSKFLYALPAHLAGIRVDYPESFDSDVRSRREWELGRLFQAQNTDRYHDVYRWSRLLPILVTVLGAYLVCEWSSRLFGARAGTVAMCVWCWMPPILAHGSLITSDILSSVILISAARSFWAFLIKPNLRSAIVAGIMLGLAQVTKFTLLVLYPCWAVFLILRFFQLAIGRTRNYGEKPTGTARFFALGLTVFTLSILVIDAFYLFQDVGISLIAWKPASSSLGRDLPRLVEGSVNAWLLHVPVPLPLEFIRGLDAQLADTEKVRSAYLLGHRRLGGWSYWYAVASLLKTPLPAIALILLALYRLSREVRRHGPVFWAILCLLVPATEVFVMIAATTGTGTNAAFRYLLPSVALLCVCSGRAWDRRSKPIRLATQCLLAWLAVNAIAGLPDHLGWHNEIGWLCSRQRPALLGDSLDWGQDLARLGNWINLHPLEGGTIVCAYGLGEIEPYGARPPAVLPASTRWDQATHLAISANILFGYEVDQRIGIGGNHSSIERNDLSRVQNCPTYTRIGKNIRIYSIHDL